MNNRRIQGAGSAPGLAAAAVLLPIPAPHAARVNSSSINAGCGRRSPVDLPFTDPVLEWNVHMLDAISTATQRPPPLPLGSHRSTWLSTIPWPPSARTPGHMRASTSRHLRAHRLTRPRSRPRTSRWSACYPPRTVARHLYASSLSTRGLTRPIPASIRRRNRLPHSRVARGGRFRVGTVPVYAAGCGQSWRLGPHASSLRAGVLPGLGHSDPLGHAAGIPVPRPAASAPSTATVYRRDVEEVRDFGALDSIVRTSYQTDVRDMVASLRRDPLEPDRPTGCRRQGAEYFRERAAVRAPERRSRRRGDRVLGLQYAYNVWRPISAIRNADGVHIPADPNWHPFLVTPAFPEYPSAHNEISGAMAQILIARFGDTPGVDHGRAQSGQPGLRPFLDAIQSRASTR